eukprot:CAMPEP_0182422626 /NCGR_PEP_ID=MMETSP1167-20130531/8353_1 /TAXON_ID=2988 /ORGANISM="Mallomonas Sp, Strain CCMP3275" /LENGTH=289 /DNA_ID=CAMNT_0024600827 /DNA_START=381 /DNA_END=1250 /DNA_ORIENTATION=+
MASFVASLLISMMMPLREWKWTRKIGQLWYEVFQVQSNISKEERLKLVSDGENKNYVVCMHPHGIIPIHACIWSAYCDQYLVDNDGHSLYGFGAAADVVFSIPFLRNMLAWLGCTTAGYKVLKAGILDGDVPCVTSTGRIPRHLFLLPGGIAEVFTSTTGRQAVVFKKRKGLIRLSLETGANLVPAYTFGVTDLYSNLPLLHDTFAYLSRRLRMGMIPFFGQFGLPIPFTSRLTMVFADPIPVERWTGEGPIPEDKIEDLHGKYLESLTQLFEKYKASAGYPEAQLEIL